MFLYGLKCQLHFLCFEPINFLLIKIVNKNINKGLNYIFYKPKIEGFNYKKLLSSFLKSSSITFT